MPDRLAEHAGHDAIGCPLLELEGKRAPDAVAHEEELLDAEVIHQPELVVGEGAPGVVDRDRAAGLAAVGVALVHRDAAEICVNSSIALITAVGQLLTREFKPPPGVTSRGKPEPASS